MKIGASNGSELMLIKELNAIEDSAGLWEPEIGGLHLWAVVRSPVFYALHEREHTVTPVTRPGLLNRVRDVRPLDLLRAFQRLSRIASHDALFFTYSSTRISHSNTGFSFDRLYEPYFDRWNRPLIFENRLIGYRLPPSRQDIVPETALWAQAFFHGLRRPLSASERSLIEDYVQTLARCFQLSPQPWRKKLLQQLPSFLAMPGLLKRQVLKRLDLSTAFVHAAAYMGSRAPLVAALHEAGYTVLEPQHGIIYDNHFAYQFSETCLSDPTHPCRRYLPDAVLTYGDYWNRSIRGPFRVETVGYPYLNKIAAKANGVSSSQILIVSQSMERPKVLKITEALASAYPKYKIILKLHPGEAVDAAAYQPLTHWSNVDIRIHADIYELIGESEVVVGFGSTVMYEAFAFPGKRILIWDNAFVSPEIGERFNSVEELVTLLGTEPGSAIVPPDNQFWADNWVQRITAVLKSL